MGDAPAGSLNQPDIRELRNNIRLLHVVALLPLLLVAACGEASFATTDQPDRATASSESSALLVWTMRASASAGTALVLPAVPGAGDIRVTCRRNPPDLYVSASAISRIRSEDRLTLEVGEKRIALDIAEDAPDDTPIHGSAALTPSIIAAVKEGGAIRLTYGEVIVGEFPPLPSQLRTRFVSACELGLAG